MEFHPQGIDRLLPALHLLYLIEKQVKLLLTAADFFRYIIVQGIVLAQVLIAQILEVEVDDS